MLEAQKANAEWMADVIRRREISARAWAEKAGMGKDTVSRAIKDDYGSVTKASTLIRLADAIGERPPGIASAIPSAESLCGILDVLLAAVLPSAPVPQDILDALARALRDTLVHLADEPPAQADPALSRMLARATTRQLDLPTA